MDDHIRQTMARLARCRDQRINVWSQNAPCDWNPTQVINPETEMPFTDSSAWNFIADLLEAGHEFTEVILAKPPGEIAYETELTLRHNLPPLYIKIQYKGKIWGRSFHNSTVN
jgi:hypothetical protein